MIFVLVIHSIVCVLLVTVILMQSGRGGGLTEGFAAAETMFGARTNEFMVRATSILAVLFVITSLSLAYFSARRDQSLMERLMDKTKNPDIKINIPMDGADKKIDDSSAAPKAKDEKAAQVDVSTVAVPEKVNTPEAVPVAVPEKK